MTIDGMIHRQRVIVCRFSKESGRNGEEGKSHALSNKPTPYFRGIKWSLRALASMQAVRLFLRARAVITYVLRAASTLKNTDSEQRALRKCSRRNLDISLLKINVLR